LGADKNEKTEKLLAVKDVNGPRRENGPAGDWNILCRGGEIAITKS